MIDVGLLGTGGTMPLPERFLSSALVRCGGELILIDCGEGTQVSLRKLGWGLKDIGTVLITTTTPTTSPACRGFFSLSATVAARGPNR